MDTLVDFLIQHGQLGMFISAFLAGSILPFSSEVVMAALQLGGADPWGLVLWGTLGNTLGGLLNYGIGRLGREAMGAPLWCRGRTVELGASRRRTDYRGDGLPACELAAFRADDLHRQGIALLRRGVPCLFILNV